MSNVNIKRAIENIKASTTVYTPIVEVVVNAIQAVESTGRKDGRITIRVRRDSQTDIDGNLPEIHSFEIEDNGVGFTDQNREAFDTLYTDIKIAEGGKGFGRFTCLKYFEDLHVVSVYNNNNAFMQRKFSMGKDNAIIVGETVTPFTTHETGTIVHLSFLKKDKSIEKKLTTIAKNLVERLLPFFISKDYECPSIILSEHDGTDSVRLNDYINNELSDFIIEIPLENNSFNLQGRENDEEFFVRVFKLFSPKNQKSKIALVAHKREVSGSVIHKYIPEFIDDFYEKTSNGELIHNRNYIIKAYVFGQYLDRNVSLERAGFEFQMDNDILLGISQHNIESSSAEIAKIAVGNDIVLRQEKKKEHIQNYVDSEAPWHKSIVDKIDLASMPYNPSNEEIEIRLQKEKFTQETQIRRDVSNLLAESNIENLKKNVIQIVSKISGSGKNDLIHYIALRKNIIDIFCKSLQVDETGKYSSEGIVHDIIFPRKGNTDITSFEDHNLWIIDERLNFTSYVSSDTPLNGKNTDRPDLLVYNKRILFRGDNEPGNPVIVFEFKKPQRDDFADQSSQEDPVQQIVRYVNNIRDGKYKTPEGRKMLVAENTPFYGYVVCDLTPKVENWLEREKDFKPMPDRLGWFQWMGNINLYIEVISWDKVLRDVRMRNQIFFQKLGI